MAETVSLQLRMTPTERDMIKSDAKALGMTPARYVVTLAGCVNETMREMATTEFTTKFATALVKGINDATTSEK